MSFAQDRRLIQLAGSLKSLDAVTSVKAVTGPTTQGPSYDCSKASNSVERQICSDKQFGELEWLVAGAFKRALDNQVDKLRQRSSIRDARMRPAIAWLAGNVSLDIVEKGRRRDSGR
jgi:hypothetical protein